MKKAQIQIQETIVVIFIVAVILIIGLIFFHKFQSRSIINEHKNYETEKFNSQLLIVPALPELQCSKLSETENCIDVLKLKSIKNTDLRISVKQIYPDEELIYNNLIATKKLVRKSPVSLYNPYTKKYSVGELVIEKYEEGTD